jgi:CRP-like cAMP-binding protein
VTPSEPQFAQFQRIDEHIDRPNRIALVHPIIKAFRQQCRLLAIRPSNETLHHPPRFSKGIIASVRFSHRLEMFLTVTGKFLVKEIGVELPPGRLMGELGFLTPNKRRTATVECIEDGQVLTITYERLLEIYF